MHGTTVKITELHIQRLILAVSWKVRLLYLYGVVTLHYVRNPQTSTETFLVWISKLYKQCHRTLPAAYLVSSQTLYR